MRKLTILICGVLLLSGAALAGINDLEPASILVFPYVSAAGPKETLVSVTNVNTNIEYEFVYGTLYGDVWPTFTMWTARTATLRTAGSI